MQINPKAKVFISCGQRKKADELQTAQEIGKRLTELGFDYYIALEEQTLRGVKDNIFRQLEVLSILFLLILRERKLALAVVKQSIAVHSLVIRSWLLLLLWTFLFLPFKRKA